MKKQFSEEEARDAAREATQNRMATGSVECSAMCQVSAGALPAAPAMNQQLLAMLACTEHWPALHQKPSNTHHLYSFVDPELEELRSRLSHLHTRVRQQEEQQDKYHKHTGLGCFNHTSLRCVSFDRKKRGMEAEDQPQQHHKCSEAIKDLSQQLNEAKHLANHH